MSESTFGRIERGELPSVRVNQLALACAAVGLKFAGRPYPDADPVRDAAHSRLLQRLRDRLPHHTRWETEVPIPLPGDLRAWDAQFRIANVLVGVEAEMRLFDVQALDRRIALKRRDSHVDVVILLIAATAANRRSLREHREALRANFPEDTRAVLRAVAVGQPPPRSAIVLL